MGSAVRLLSTLVCLLGQYTKRIHIFPSSPVYSLSCFCHKAKYVNIHGGELNLAVGRLDATVAGKWVD